MTRSSEGGSCRTRAEASKGQRGDGEPDRSRIAEAEGNPRKGEMRSTRPERQAILWRMSSSELDPKVECQAARGGDRSLRSLRLRLSPIDHAATSLRDLDLVWDKRYGASSLRRVSIRNVPAGRVAASLCLSRFNASLNRSFVLRAPRHCIARRAEVDMPRQSLPETTTPHIEKLKYLLATSALLSPSLYDALELFPSATSFEEYKGKGKQKELPVATWPDGWTTIGQTRQDRDAWANTRLLVRFLINVSKRAARGLDAGASNAVHAPMDAGRSSAAATRNFGRGAAHAEDAESTSIKAVRDFITEAQRLDRLIEAAMDRFATTELYVDPTANPPSPLRAHN